MISGRLRKVVAFENRTTKGLFRGEVPTHLLLFFYGREFIVRNFLVTYRRSFMLSLKVPCMRPRGGGLMKGVGMLVRNFELNLKETMLNTDNIYIFS